MRPSLILFAITALFSGCATAPKELPDILPTAAVISAAGQPDEGVTGIFRLEIRSAGREGDSLHLFSETDPRDQRCLKIAITGDVARELELELGGVPAEMLRGVTLRVAGTAKRVTTWFVANGVRSDKYYYQTIVAVSDRSQIRILPGATDRRQPESQQSVELEGTTPRGIAYVDYVPSPTEMKAQLEQDGWKDVKVIREFPDYLQGPIRALGLYSSPNSPPPSGPAQEFGRIAPDHVEYLNLVLGTEGIVTAPIEFADGRRGTTFHMAVKQHYVIIIWNPSDRSGYIWRSFLYDAMGMAMEMRFLIQRQDLKRI